MCSLHCIACVLGKIQLTNAALNHIKNHQQPLTSLGLYSEKKIDLIDDRLGTITKLLKELKTSAPFAPSQELQFNTSDVARSTTVASSPNVTEFAAGPGVEGESSLSAHSVFVNEFLQGFAQPDPEIRRTLNDLSNIVGNAGQQGNSEDSPRTDVKKRSDIQRKKNTLPPFSKVAALIRLAKGMCKYSIIRVPLTYNFEQ